MIAVTRAAAFGLLIFASGCSGGDDAVNELVGAVPVNQAPSFTSASAVSVPENGASSFYTARATDPEGVPVFYSLASSGDSGLFQIQSATGALSFRSPPDFEAPGDADRNNIYQVAIRASDGFATTSLALTVTVTDLSGAVAARRVGVGFASPLFALGTGDGTGRLFVVQQGGAVRILDPATGTIAATPFLTAAGLTTDGERGLLGMTLAPDYAASGAFYVFATGSNGQLQIRRYRRSSTNPDVADPTADIIFTADHAAFSNHNGGWIGFGPDGFLYIATGDGGGGGDPGNNAQNTASLLGKILRIDVSGDDFPADADRDYRIPTGNPFRSAGGAPEVVLWGLRNPFRNAFDPQTGVLYIGDVGQGAIEEIDAATPAQVNAGANYGWRLYEGTAPYPPGSTAAPTAGLTFPVAQYAHGTGATEGNSVIGGHVYRGPIQALRGHYFFADFVRPRIWTIPVSSLLQGQTLTGVAFTSRIADLAPDAGGYTNISSFGVDDGGNLYIVDIDGEIFRIVEND